jgi:hypothetical protein
LIKLIGWKTECRTQAGGWICVDSQDLVALVYKGMGK